MAGFKKAPKYKNKRVEHEGATFDSMAELARWLHLVALRDRGEIRDLVRQVAFVLVPAAKINGRTVRAMKYVADFEYWTADGRRVIEDVKGMLTPTYKLKRHLMKAILGLDITEITKGK